MGLRLPSIVPFRPPKEREPPRETAGDRLRGLPTVPKQQADQLQTAALAARLTDILTGGGGEDDGSGDRLTRLDMNSELLLRRMAVLLRRHAPKVGPAE